jgi:AraC-like DNA-binding protein
MTNFINLCVPSVLNYDIKYYFQDSNATLPPKIWPLHVHDRMEIYILLEGDVSFAVESTLYKLNPGDAIIIKPNEMHNCILDSESVHRHICFWIDASCDFLFRDFLLHDFGKSNIVTPDEEAGERLSEIYRRLKLAADKDDMHKQFYLTLEMLDIFRGFISTVTEPIVLPELLQRILADIDDNFITINSLDYFTKKYFVSSSTLNRLFRTYLHTTPKLYIETKRLANSRLLLKSGRSVIDACREAGFPDYSNYIRLFKKRFGITPKQYKDGR